MKKITKTQITTIIFLISYGIWEFYVARWAATESGPIIRVDLVVIYPILILFIFLSLGQLFKRKNRLRR
ncbi:hypothetical protein [Tepidibacter hydrothermalis]|uniref:Uncharacterized protein n=1 Tax=Tepidibacter hydrothermalis TaxID=3036126 RepID=A0ABY8EBQ6_9FIRM|nr:hypothetical protein [Tepidibacter hydrothermalis]WFD10358.1 hypothetical protein P4S50_19010 [Tepidibacter hydrothermalis]